MEPAALAIAEFPLEQDLIYLNHAALGPWPRRTADVVATFARQNLTRASADWRDWHAAEQRLRERLARLINVPDPGDIALVQNTSQALSAVAMGLDWRRGDNVVLGAYEFPSNRLCWEACERFGVEVRLVPGDPRADAHEDLIAACDRRTRVLTVSSVQYSSGIRMNLAALGAFCAQAGIAFGIDAIQSLGAVALDATALEADFVAAGSHKWLLAPEGLAFLYTRPELRRGLTLNQFGWRMSERPFDFDTPPAGPAATGRRFEPGTLNTLGILALDASLSLYEELGAAWVEARVLENSGFLIDRLAALGLEVVTPPTPAARAGIVSARAGSAARTRGLYRALRAGGVLSAIRDGALRLSPHYHNTPEQLERVAALLADALRTGRASA